MLGPPRRIVLLVQLLEDFETQFACLASRRDPRPQID